jgi:hypothetical protein
VPDMLIAQELKNHHACDVQFASYATGAATLAENAYPVVDLKLREDGAYLDVLVRSAQLIRARAPALVVSHEEFSVLPAAKTFGVPVAFMVDFFPPPVDNVMAQSLAFADEIIFIERRGLFAEPAQARGKVRYVGPVVRPLSLTLAQRDEARRAFQIAEDTALISVIPGAWATEQRAPLAELLLPAFQALEAPRKKLIWLAGRDTAALTERVRAVPEVTVLEGYSPVERLMMASDLVITKANRGTTIELASAGVPSLSVSYGLNPIDEMIIPRIRSNTALDARGIDSTYLRDVIAGILGKAPRPTPTPDDDYAPGGAARAAAELARFIRKHSP